MTKISKLPKTKAKDHGIDAGHWGDFERKDRMYYLRGSVEPVARKLKSKNIFWYDPELGVEREVMFTINQTTPFVDEFKGTPKVGHIIVRDGVLSVPKEKKVLQWILSYLSPELNKVYLEQDDLKEAVDELGMMDLKFEAEKLARELDITTAEAIVRTDIGNRVDSMKSDEIKRDAILMSRQNPSLFIELANDENLEIRNKAIKASNLGIIKLSDDGRVFKWGSNDRILCKVPFNENPFSAITHWLKTDDGLDVYGSIEKALK